MHPGFFVSLMSASGAIPGLATRLIESGGHREPLLDALEEEGVRVISFDVGAMVYVETLTKYYVGRVYSVSPTELVLENAAWVDETGRLSEFLATGRSEILAVEPYPDLVRIPAHMITMATAWNHKPFDEVI